MSVDDTTIVQEKVAKPKIQLDLYKPDSSTPPLKIVQAMEEDEFESFITEWLYSPKFISEYKCAYRIGSSGDKGRDVIAYRKKDESYDIFQCKHYTNPIGFADFLPEISKLIVHTFEGSYLVPKHYFLIALHGVTAKLHDLIKDSKVLRSKVLQSWNNAGYIKVGNTQYPYKNRLKQYCEAFDFSRIDYYSIEEVIDEHLESPYGYIRFGSPYKIDNPSEITIPLDPSPEEDEYIRQLIGVYGDKSKIPIKDSKTVPDTHPYAQEYKSQRKSFYSALAVERAASEVFIDDEFGKLKDEVEAGVEDASYANNKDDYDRMMSILQTAGNLNTRKVPLDYKLHWVGSRETKGVCHMLVNEGKLIWWRTNAN